MEVSSTRTSSVLAATLAMPLLLGCANDQSRLEAIGAAAGAAIGGLVGNQVGDGVGNVLATTAGVGIGALAGRELARVLTDTDVKHANRAANTAIERGERESWRNPETGARGTVAPIEPVGSNGCVVTEQTAHTQNNRTVSDRVEMCRGDDGVWVADL